ncbi:MAG: hypothetical protein ACI9IA_000411 [Enterobacterales bacterium]|jgi:uncharacterized protein (TIGR03503 family)
MMTHLSIHKKFKLLILLVIILGVQFSISAAKSTKPRSDVRVLVDISGSMKLNDPDNLRIPAVQLMSNLLPPDSQAGIWTFGRYVNMLVPLGPVDNNWKKSAVESAKKINSSGLFTNIGGAMEHASFGWKAPDPDIKRSLILLTDGVVDVSKDTAVNAAARRKVLKELLPQYKEAGITIHTIALSGDADEKLLSSMASETDGWYQTVANASELQKVFLKIFEQVTERDSIPLKDNKFSIDEQIEEFTLLVFKNKDSKPTTLEQPDGESYDAGVDSKRITWFESPDYDLITINAPMTGEWRLFADVDPDNRVLVVSNLKIKNSPLPNSLLANEKITFDMRLLQEGELLNEADFLKLLSMEVELTSADGQSEVFKLLDDGQGVDEKADDGIYSIELTAPSISGVTQVSSSVESPTFHRMRQQAINIFNSPVTIEAVVSKDRDVAHKIYFVPVTGVAKADSLSIDVDVQMPNKQKLELTAKLDQGYTQAIEVQVEEVGGVYWLQTKISGTTPAGREFQVTPPAYQFLAESLLPEEPEPVIEEESLEEPLEEGESNTLLWLGIGLGINILLIVLGWLVSRFLKKRNAANAIKMSELLE